MNNVKFIKEVAKKTGYAQTVVREIMNGASNVVLENLPYEDKVSIFAGVAFTAVTHKARIFKSPLNGDEIAVPEHKVPKAVFSSKFHS